MTTQTTKQECRQGFEHPLTRQGVSVAATRRESGEWIVRAYNPAMDPGPYAVTRTKDVEEARGAWQRIVSRFEAEGYVRVS